MIKAEAGKVKNTGSMEAGLMKK